MLKPTTNQNAMKKLFKLSFKRLWTMLKSTFEQNDKMEKDLKAISFEMNDAIERLEQSAGNAKAFYQKKIN